MYSTKLFNLAINQFIDSKVSDQQHVSLSTETTTPSIRVIIMIPFKDQASVNVLKKRFTDLSSKIKTTIQPVFTRRKLNEVEKSIKLDFKKDELFVGAVLVS